MQRILVICLLGIIAVTNTACAFRGKESLTYYQGNFPQYKQGSDGRYYPVDNAGNFMPLDYGYRSDLKGYSVIVPGQGGNYPPGTIVPQQQQGAPGSAVPPRVGPSNGNSAQGGIATAPAYGAAPYAYQQQYAQPGYVPQQGYVPQRGYAPPAGTVPYAVVQPPQASAYGAVGTRKPMLPMGYYGDNDENYEMNISKEQMERESAEKLAAPIVVPQQAQQQPVAPPSGNPRLPDLNKIYSNVKPDDADSNYNIPPGYSTPDIDDYNTYYNY